MTARHRPARHHPARPSALESVSAGLAHASLLCWATAIIAGRLLAYFTYGDIGIE